MQRSYRSHYLTLLWNIISRTSVSDRFLKTISDTFLWTISLTLLWNTISRIVFFKHWVRTWISSWNTVMEPNQWEYKFSFFFLIHRQLFCSIFSKYKALIWVDWHFSSDQTWIKKSKEKFSHNLFNIETSEGQQSKIITSPNIAIEANTLKL